MLSLCCCWKGFCIGDAYIVWAQVQFKNRRGLHFSGYNIFDALFVNLKVSVYKRPLEARPSNNQYLATSCLYAITKLTCRCRLSAERISLVPFSPIGYKQELSSISLSDDSQRLFTTSTQAFRCVQNPISLDRNLYPPPVILNTWNICILLPKWYYFFLL